jgi:predicted transcriptional regulator
MSAPTVRISEASLQLLKELAEKTGQPMADVLEKALDTYRRKLFFEQMNAGYAELQADAAEWAEHLAERKAWDSTLMDGLERDERWTEDGRCPPSEAEKP